MHAWQLTSMRRLGRLAQANVSLGFACKFTRMNERSRSAADGEADRKLLAHAQQLVVTQQLCSVRHHWLHERLTGKKICKQRNICFFCQAVFVRSQMVLETKKLKLVPLLVKS